MTEHPLARHVADQLKLTGMARGVVLGRYKHMSHRGVPIQTLVELQTMSDVDLLKRPGCGHKTLAAIREALQAWDRRPFLILCRQCISGHSLGLSPPYSFEDVRGKPCKLCGCEVQIHFFHAIQSPSQRLMPVQSGDSDSPGKRQRTAIEARLFLHAYGLLSDAEDEQVKGRIRRWSEEGCERRWSERRRSTR